ncbi:hypothetical protein BKA70DRAFT_1401346 [Coprinopsis sp. MPI-PUGE-AT-0042]|nr:hypothetical protein BKA70DRAFT_1401346 [Coprinopsis sp. MPI-PUGE-AT-0042]
MRYSLGRTFWVAQCGGASGGKESKFKLKGFEWRPVEDLQVHSSPVSLHLGASNESSGLHDLWQGFDMLGQELGMMLVSDEPGERERPRTKMSLRKIFDLRLRSCVPVIMQAHLEWSPRNVDPSHHVELSTIQQPSRFSIDIACHHEARVAAGKLGNCEAEERRRLVKTDIPAIVADGPHCKGIPYPNHPLPLVCSYPPPNVEKHQSMDKGPTNNTHVARRHTAQRPRTENVLVELETIGSTVIGGGNCASGLLPVASRKAAGIIYSQRIGGTSGGARRPPPSPPLPTPWNEEVLIQSQGQTPDVHRVVPMHQAIALLVGTPAKKEGGHDNAIRLQLGCSEMLVKGSPVVSSPNIMKVSLRTLKRDRLAPQASREHKFPCLRAGVALVVVLVESAGEKGPIAPAKEGINTWTSLSPSPRIESLSAARQLSPLPKEAGSRGDLV